MFIGQKTMKCNKEARPAGFEPATYRLEGGCCYPLSYERKTTHHGKKFPPTTVTHNSNSGCDLSSTFYRNIEPEIASNTYPYSSISPSQIDGEHIAQMS